MAFKLQIRNPCAEDWNQMQTIPNGKHCESCHKDLVDFRGLNNNQIYDVVNVNHKACGLFSETQLQIEYQLPKQHNFSKVGLAVSFVSLLAFINPVKSQVPITENQIEPIAILTQYNDIVKAKPDVKNDTILVKGKVVDAHTLEPLPFVRVYIDNEKKINAISDVDGHFILKLPHTIFESTVMVKVATIGYQDITVVVTDKTEFMDIELDSSQALLGVVVVNEEPTRSQKFFDFFRRKKKKKYTNG